MPAQNTNETDVALAHAFFPILVERAAGGGTITYAELAEEAKNRHPNDEVVAKAHSRSAGRRLDVLRAFTSHRGWPDLSSIVVNGSTGEVGQGFSDSFNPELTREAVYDFDWSDARLELEAHLISIRNEIAVKASNSKKSLAVRSKTEATKAMQEFAMSNKSRLNAPANTARQREHQRETLIDLLMKEQSVEAAFEKAGLLRSS